MSKVRIALSLSTFVRLYHEHIQLDCTLDSSRYSSSDKTTLVYFSLPTLLAIVFSSISKYFRLVESSSMFCYEVSSFHLYLQIYSIPQPFNAYGILFFTVFIHPLHKESWKNIEGVCKFMLVSVHWFLLNQTYLLSLSSFCFCPERAIFFQ